MVCALHSTVTIMQPYDTPLVSRNSHFWGDVEAEKFLYGCPFLFLGPRGKTSTSFLLCPPTVPFSPGIRRGIQAEAFNWGRNSWIARIKNPFVAFSSCHPQSHRDSLRAFYFLALPQMRHSNNNKKHNRSCVCAYLN